MHRLTSVAVAVFSATWLLTGCGDENRPANQAALAQQALPSAIADPPNKVDLPHYQARNPHFDVMTKDGNIVIRSDDHGWNGHTIDVYYAPPEAVMIHDGDYVLRDTTHLQRIASVPLKGNQTWVAVWNVKGHTLPREFYLLAKTNVGQANIEHVLWMNQRYIEGGAESRVQ
ncbi:hypothetical protein Alches_10290 [Alicyclobacillus hesperidum subsp. aegles]|uniref:hypothetical protein n=1 Tax=Alicyclobacillus hesperidum TaxID=89784 RepID=UPI00222C046B|nr:hypothetical protein [Alicyclobacillus hesperidum]GLG00990.1 hypothetical protein Alches_10290 [Alicyclobacillus hesperidum subsp. aegles]